ncbi:MAG TPA: SH3 domain-containing protein [Methyloceanibacter sp.]
MGQWALSPSELAKPRRLADRLATEVRTEITGEPKQGGEATVSSMAERFAPEAQKGFAAGAGEPLIEPTVILQRAAEARRDPSVNRWVITALSVVSLIPAALLLMVLWRSGVSFSGLNGPITAGDDAQAPTSQQASVAATPSIPKTTTRIEPDIALTAPVKLVAKAGEEVAFDVTLDTDEVLPSRSVVAIRAMPEGATFSQGRPYGETEWSLRPDEIGDLRLRVPPGATGASDLHIDLVAADGTILASAITRLDIAPDPKQALILRASESGRIDDLIAHGQKMIDVGYFAGARAYFKRAAEAGSGQAALMVGATYDQAFIDKIGAQGIKADPKEAIAWYERAKQLGVDDGDAKLAELRDQLADNSEPEPVPSPAPAAVAPVAEATPAPDPALPAVTVSGAPDGAFVGKDEWVAMSSYANLRTAPSSTAETVKVAEKGTKLRVAGRKGNWVQVTDPATSETGWVYSRYVEETPSP